MGPDEPTQSDAANAELYTNRLEEDPLTSKLGVLIYAMLMAAAFVAITVYRHLGEMQKAPPKRGPEKVMAL